MALSQTFFQAIHSGDEDAVLELLKQDPLLANTLNKEGIGPIAAALYSFKRPLAERLIAAGVEPNFFENCALGDLEGISKKLSADPLLVNAFSPDGFTPLTLAAAFGGPEAVRFLIEKGADTELRAQHAFIKVVPLHAAVFGNRTEVVRALLEKGANPNDTQPGGFTALHGAAQNGNREMAQLLLDAGAHADAKTEEGKTAADFASETGHEELAAIL